MTSAILRHKLGRDGPEIPAMGFGLMGLSVAYGPAMPDEKRLAMLDHAYESGVRFWDTANVYTDNEDLLGKWFKANPGKRENIFLATKFGLKFDRSTGRATVCNEPEYIQQCVESSLSRLGTDYIDLYYAHRLDREQPVEIGMRELKRLKEEGKIRHIGLSEVSADSLRRACKIVHVDAHQVEYNPFTMDIESAETNVLATCRELGVATVAYSPLGRGFLTGSIRSTDDFAADDFRRLVPRFSKENFHKNLELVDAIKDLAQARGCTAGQLTLAFLMHQGDDIFPIPGTTKTANFDENRGALTLKLSDEELKTIRAAIDNTEVQGARYPPGMNQSLFVSTVPLTSETETVGVKGVGESSVSVTAVPTAQ